MAIWKAKTKGKHCFFCLATDTEETADCWQAIDEKLAL
jgi:hypothetical protein